jgi:hypothetical protein
MNNPDFVVNDVEWAYNLEESLEEYIWQCEASVDGEEEDTFSTLSGEPFCGCTTCYTREQLFFLVPKIIHAYKDKKVALTADEE